MAEAAQFVMRDEIKHGDRDLLMQATGGA